MYGDKVDCCETGGCDDGGDKIVSTLLGPNPDSRIGIPIKLSLRGETTVLKINQMPVSLGWRREGAIMHFACITAARATTVCIVV
jgi:hypothetical protein